MDQIMNYVKPELLVLAGLSTYVNQVIKQHNKEE